MEATFRSQPRVPDILYCVAGGCASECGFFTDIDAGQLAGCMKNNYFSAAHAAQSTLKMWIEDDGKPKPPPCKLRQIVFINSAAAFVGLPGYAAYTRK